MFRKIRSRNRQVVRKFFEGLSRYGVARTLSGLVRYIAYKIRKPSAGKVCTVTDHLSFWFKVPEQLMPSLVTYRELVQSEIEFLRRIVKPDDLLVNAGAGIGCYAVFAAKVCRARVHAFEPVASNAETVRRNLKENGLDARVVLNACAVSDAHEPLVIRRTGGTSFNASLSKTADPSSGVVVDCITLDSYCSRHHLDHIHVLEMDVEGHDPHVLSGAKNLLAACAIDVLMLEIHYTYSETYQQVLGQGFAAFYFDLANTDLVPINPMNKENLIRHRPSGFNRRVIFVRTDKLSEIKRAVRS